MKMKLIVILMSSACSFSIFAADIHQGEQALSHASRMSSAAESRVNAAASSYGSGSPSSWSDASESAAREQTNANAQMRGAISTLANATATQRGPIASPQVQHPQATPTINAPQAVPHKTPSYSVPTKVAQLTPQIAPTKQPQITGATYRSYVTQLQVATINVAASSLKPNTPVNVTVNGVTHTVPASTLAPSTQVSVPHVPAFVNVTNSNTHDKAAQHSGHTNHNRGSDNAHSHAFGGHGYGADNSRSEGFGGHSHFH